MTRRHVHSRGVGFGLIAALVVLVAALPLQGGSASAADTPVTVDVTPSSGLQDGDVVTAVIKTSSDFRVFEAIARLCRSDVDYEDGDANSPAHDFDPAGGNCPSVPISSSAEAPTFVKRTNLANVTREPDGAIMRYRVGTGVIEWGEGDEPFRLECDPEHPCSLVVQVLGGPTGGEVSWVPHVTELTYGAGDAITSCGGPAPGIVSSGGSDRFSDAYVRWTLAQCEDESSVGALTRSTFTGEGESLAPYSIGLNDLAYTALGYYEPAKLAEAATPRPSVLVPVALNAVVLAVGGGPVLSNGNRVPYQDITLTTEQYTALLSGGKEGMRGTVEEFALENEIQETNPELTSGGMFDSLATRVVGAASERSVVAYLTTLFAKELEPELFRVPEFGAFAEELQGEPRAVDSSFALATPSYAAAVDTFSGRPVLKQDLARSVQATSGGGIWVFTDLATARAFGLTVVKLKLPNGDVAEPTEASMRAAVAKMDEDDEGVRIPDPTMTTQGDGPVPYPLTFVEYAMAPAQPLFTAAPACVLRPESQDNMATWLEYVTGPGQQSLPAGMVPLSDDMADEAAEAIGDVGESEVTGACAGKTVTPATTSTTSTSTTAPGSSGGATGGSEEPSGGGTGGGTGGSGSSSRSPSSSAGSGAAAASDGLMEINEEPDEVELAMPAFSGVVSGSPWRAIVSLIGIVGLTSIVTLATAGSGVIVRRREGEGPPMAGSS